MKKSKVIVPALAMIGLSSVASITGSVAWFTAQRTGSITTDSFVVTKTDGNLQVEVAAGIGTKQSTSDNKKIELNNANNKIADASFNPSTKQLYIDSSNDEHGVAEGYIAIGDGTSYLSDTETGHVYVVSSEDHVYHAFTWKVNISYTWGADHRDLNVFFDYNASTMTPKESAGGDITTAGTSKGFRIAIVNQGTTSANDHTIVWSKLNTVDQFIGTTGLTASDSKAYGTSPLNTANFSYFGSDKYGLGNAASATTISDGNIEHATDSTDNQRTRADFLDKLVYTEAVTNVSTKTFTCVAWYEGNDSAVTGDDLEQVASTVAFYSAINK